MKSYEEFNDVTKKFLNKAMDIYATIKNEKIVKIVKKFGQEESYSLTKLDKKILSLFIAGFTVDGELKDILDEYDDIKVKDLFSFINLKVENIKQLEENEYGEFYDKNLKMALMGIMVEDTISYILNKVTPETIFLFLGEIDGNISKILDYLAEACNLNCLWLHRHPSFKAVENFALIKGSLQKKTFTRKNNVNRPFLFSSVIPTLGNNSLDLNEYKKTDKEKSEQVIGFDSENIWNILDGIQKKFVGQEVATEYLFYNIVNNQQLALRDGVADGERSIIFLDGPTGTGKTAITREITDKLDIPFTSTSATNYSSTGYVGGNITDTLKELYQKADGDLKKAQRGIIVFDEFDKISYSRSGGLEMKKAVQQQLLDFMGGGKYNITVGGSLFDRKEIEFDTSKLTFICLGALSELRDIKLQKKPSIGFESKNEVSDTDVYSIVPQDLVDIGLERELVGRFNTYLHTEEYSKDDLLKILKESSISPLIGFEKWVSSNGKKLQIDDDVYDTIASIAHDLNTGARSLQTVMNNIRTPFIKKVLREKDEIIYLDSDTVISINGRTVNRRRKR